MRASLVIALIPVTFITLFLVAPVAYLVGSLALRVGEGLDYLYVKIPPDGELYRVYSVGSSKVIALTGYDFGPLANTLILASIVSTTTTALAILTAVACLSLRGPYRILLGYIAPLIASLPAPLVSAYTVIHLFHRDFGLVNRLLGELLGVKVSLEGIAGVAVYQVISFYPLAHLIILAYMESMDRSVVESAYNLGGRGLDVVLRILVPLSKPAIIVALSLTFVLSAEDLSGPIAFSRYNSARNVLSYTAYYDFISELGYTISVRAITYVAILSIIASTAFIATWRHLRSYAYPIISPSRITLDLGLARWPLLTLTLFMVTLSIAPTALVILYSVTEGWFGSETPRSITLNNYATVLSNGYYARALLNTIAYVLLALPIAMLLAYISSYASLRLGGPLSPLVEVSVVLPIALPGIAVGIGYFTLFHELFKEIPPLDPMVNPAPYIVLAYASRRLTYASRPIAASMQKIPRSLEEQALNMGSKPLGVARTILAPLLLNPALVGGALAAMHMATEFSVSIVLAGGYGVSPSHPSPVTPVVLNALTYNPLAVHTASALLMAALLSSTISSTIVVLLMTWAISRIRFKDLLFIVKGY